MLLLPSLLPAEPVRNFKWITSYELATSQARKSDKLIMAYFSGSDWDPWTDKLDKEVLSTDLFKAWAVDHVIPMQIDFPQNKRLSSITKGQNDKLKTQYTISKVPTFIFLDATGAPIARASYEDLRLRAEETKGQPKAAIEFLDNLLKTRPKDEVLKTFPNFTDARLFAKKNYSCLLIAITQGYAPYWLQQRDALFKDQTFVRYVNHNVPFISMDWPLDSDNSPAAKDFRDFAEKHKITPSPFQLIVWDVPQQYDKIKARYRSFSLQHVDQLVNQISLQLPRVDYTGNWITDYNLARTISAQTGRYMFLAFTSMDGGEWSKKMDDEIFKSEPFLTYAHKHMVLVRVDFPTTATQPAVQEAQNKMLAEMYNIRGFPMVVVVNPKGEKLLESKYLKGGPEFFMKQMTPIIDRDADRLAALKEND
jgi:thioredoxin-related protein